MGRFVAWRKGLIFIIWVGDAGWLGSPAEEKGTVAIVGPTRLRLRLRATRIWSLCCSTDHFKEITGSVEGEPTSSGAGRIGVGGSAPLTPMSTEKNPRKTRHWFMVAEAKFVLRTAVLG
jgi:hypothetical protein